MRTASDGTGKNELTGTAPTGPWIPSTLYTEIAGNQPITNPGWKYIRGQEYSTWPPYEIIEAHILALRPWHLPDANPISDLLRAVHLVSRRITLGHVEIDNSPNMIKLLLNAVPKSLIPELEELRSSKKDDHQPNLQWISEDCEKKLCFVLQKIIRCPVRFTNLRQPRYIEFFGVSGSVYRLQIF